jgi:predicted ATP-dependent endonuclease of OLD family
MKIKIVEIQNFRKLKSTRIEFSEKTTLFVGANNSGKTSAMVALGHFLVEQIRFTTNDFTLSSWRSINKIGAVWEDPGTQQDSQNLTMTQWEEVLPCMDVWLQIAQHEIHHVCHLLPTLDWDGGLLGVRLRLEPKDIEELYKEYISARKAAQNTIDAAMQGEDRKEYTVALWPSTMANFLELRLHSQFLVRAYSLDPNKLVEPCKGTAFPQVLPLGSVPIEGNPFKGLIHIDEIVAQRGLSDVGSVPGRSRNDGEEGRERSDKRKLSEQLRAYYTKHIDPSEMPEPSDVDALEAIYQAETRFDEKLKDGFGDALKEVEGLGYPGITDPKLIITTKIRLMDGLNHPSALQYEVCCHSIEEPTKKPPCLPEQYCGLGYQNLISMVFRLMSFRDGWMQVGKAGKIAAAKTKSFFPPPLHLVLVEEPEAHLHAQVQQVFIRKAYEILRAHGDLGDNTALSTQLVVSTHSSHIAHECEFACLRYFRRRPAIDVGEVPTSIVVNLSEVFGEEGNTQRFVTRYLKATHCDLFFADAAILVEGPAERMLVPHFIREHFKSLNQSYVTLLEIGGSHAHRLRELIEHLGLVTLVITDLDAAEPTGDRSAKQPVRCQGQITRNATLKTWLPAKEKVDELLDMSAFDKVKEYDPFFSVRVAYQCPVTVQFDEASAQVEALSNTFEDALVFENLSIFKNLEGDGLIKKFKDAISKHQTSPDLAQAIFTILKTGDKAKFALDLLYSQDPYALKVPTYINDGLSWLQDQLQTRREEVLVPCEIPGRASEGANA